MTKKDFKLIAQTIRELSFFDTEAKSPNELREIIAYQFSNVLPQTNPRFNRQKFLEACK